jgi:hypothetical protein
MDFFFSFFETVVENKAAENIGNEITFVNFMSQAMSNEIMTKDKCNDNNISDKDAYLNLYDYLVKKNIIISKNTYSFFFTGSSSYNVNPDKTNQSDIENALKKKELELPSLKCYTISYSRLSILLKKYNNNILGGSRKNKKNKTKKIKQKK